MAAMSEKERFARTMSGSGADRFPFFDLEPAEDALERWRREGLARDRSVAETFGLEEHHSAGVTLRRYPYFKPAPDLLDDPAAFERHYSLDNPGRFADDLAARGRCLVEQGRVISVDGWGGGLLQMLGVGGYGSLEAALYAMVERPERVDELVERTTDFYCLCLDRLLRQVPADYATFYEPIASNHGPVISPAMFRRFALPGYRKVISLLESHGVRLRFFCSTGGDLSLILPPLLEAGLNGLWISNIQSEGMQYSALRRRYGSELALIGGIPSAALKSDPGSIRAAVREIAPALLQCVRYLPCLDDRPRSDIPFEHYRIFRLCLAELAEES